ncbi:ProQ/FINO family protein [Vreelandella zhanjiangensis]|uniref:ProQ/FINO family protein n=1 Tax=Vreelandella zhanjiangensis TaxID=1121960 RepID=UPI000365BD85|nr:ProQ/FINO family protein [Halomonas zhanjiangensis]
MTASVMHLLDSLESRLEQAQAELQNLRNENAQLKQQLVEQAVTLQKTLEEPGVPAQEARAPESGPAASEPSAAQQDVSESLSSEPMSSEPISSEPMSSKPALDKQTQDVQEQEAASQAPVVEQPSPHSLLKEWYQRYPQAFFKGHTKPLKIGIHQDLAAREPWSGKLIRRTLANYVNLPRYLKSVREGVDRIDLDGQPAGKVDKEASLHANDKRNEKQAKGQSKGAQEVAKKDLKNETEQKVDAPKQNKSSNVAHSEAKKTEPQKPLSLEDKLKGLQQKFEVR